jgi:SAM-dependent methyltransferase
MTQIGKLRLQCKSLEADAGTLADLIATALMAQPTKRPDLEGELKQLMLLRVRIRAIVTAFERLQRADASASDADHRRYFKDVRHRLRLLMRVAAMVEMIDARQPVPMYHPRPLLHDLSAQQVWVSDAVFKRLHRMVTPLSQTDDALGHGCFPDIPMSPMLFVEHAHLAYRVALAQRREGPLRFLDVGCGGGIKVLLAAEVFGLADGLEYDAAYAATAANLLRDFGTGRTTAIHGDGLTFDAYGQYDVIYFYQPMSDKQLLHALEDRILSQARLGTILIAPYQMFLERSDRLACGRIGGPVYIAGMTQSQADDLAQEVLHIGPDILNPDRALDTHDSWLRPLWLACARNGWLPD